MSVAVETNMAIEAFRFNEAEYKLLLMEPVVQDLVRRAIRIESSAKQHAKGRPGPNVRTGRLWGSITYRIGVDAQSPYVDVGSAVHYAPFVELGTSRAPAYPFLRPALEAARTT